MNIYSRSTVRLIQPEQFGENLSEKQWHLDSVKAVLVRPWQVRVRTEFDAPLTRLKYITNQILDQHGRTPFCTRCSLGTGAHSSECRAPFEAIWTKELAEAEVANRADDSIPMGPDARENEPLESTEAAGTTCCDGGRKHGSSR